MTSELCGECGARHRPDENTLCPGWRPATAETPPINPPPLVVEENDLSRVDTREGAGGATENLVQAYNEELEQRHAALKVQLIEVRREYLRLLQHNEDLVGMVNVEREKVRLVSVFADECRKAHGYDDESRRTFRGIANRLDLIINPKEEEPHDRKTED